MIRLLTTDFLEESQQIMKEVVADMLDGGIDQWDEIYPSLEDLRNDILGETAFGYFEENRFGAYFVMNDVFSPEYESLDWKVSGKALFIHRLSVKPSMQGRGIAKFCMSFAEAFARKNGYDAIRLDAFPKNRAAIRLYEHLNYSKIGSVMFRKGEFYCYEKSIGEYNFPILII